MWCEHRFRAQEDGANITVNSVHPGLIMTPLMRHSALLMSLLFSLSTSLSLKIVQIYAFLTISTTMQRL